MTPTLRQLLEAPERAESLPPDAIAPVLGELIVLLARLLTQVAPPARQALKQDEPQDLLTVPEAAARLGFRPAYLYDLIRRHRFPAVRSGKHLRVLPRDVDEWVHHHREETLDANVKRSLGSPSPMRRLTPKPKGQGSS